MKETRVKRGNGGGNHNRNKLLWGVIGLLSAVIVILLIFVFYISGDTNKSAEEYSSGSTGISSAVTTETSVASPESVSSSQRVTESTTASSEEDAREMPYYNYAWTVDKGHSNVWNTEKETELNYKFKAWADSMGQSYAKYSPDNSFSNPGTMRVSDGNGSFENDDIPLPIQSDIIQHNQAGGSITGCYKVEGDPAPSNATDGYTMGLFSWYGYVSDTPTGRTEKYMIVASYSGYVSDDTPTTYFFVLDSANLNPRVLVTQGATAAGGSHMFHLVSLSDTQNTDLYNLFIEALGK